MTSARIRRLPLVFWLAVGCSWLAGCATTHPAAEVDVSPEKSAEVRELAEAMNLEFDDVNDSVDDEGHTPLMLAAWSGHSQLTERLLAIGADPNIGDNKGLMPLHLAAAKNNITVARFLLQNGAKIDARSEGGNAPLHAAALGNAVDVVKLLVVSGASPNVENSGGGTPLHAAAHNNSAEVIRNILIHPDVNVNVPNANAQTPLHFAARGDHLEAATLLVESGAHINAADDNGDVPLHTAAKNDANGIAAFLLKNSADLDAQNNEGHTSLEIAKRRINMDFIVLVEEFVATRDAEKKTEKEAESVRHESEKKFLQREAEKKKQREQEEINRLAPTIEEQYALAEKYHMGDGVLQDNAEAAKWYRRAAERGHVKAQFNLDTMYAEKTERNVALPRWYFGRPEDGEKWLVEMSSRLQRILPKWSPYYRDTGLRRDLLKSVHYEATRAGLDPQLVLAVIHTESAFRKYAISTAGAHGLMHVIPSWVNKIGNKNDNLFDIRTNLRYGATILRHYLWDREGGDLFRALGRYDGSVGEARYPRIISAKLDEYWRY